MKKDLYPSIVSMHTHSYYHSKMYKISTDVIDQWCYQNKFSVICCQNNGRVIFGRCKKGYAVLFKDCLYSKDLFPYYLCHFTRNIDNSFMELL